MTRETIHIVQAFTIGQVVDGLFLDRHRLLAPGHGSSDWVSDDLSSELVAWTDKRIATLPEAAPR